MRVSDLKLNFRLQMRILNCSNNRTGVAYFLFVFMGLVHIPIAVNFDHEWRYNGFDRFYQIVTDRQYSFDEAVERCNQTGSVLASIADLTAYTFIMREIQEIWDTDSRCQKEREKCRSLYYTECRFHSCLNFWIGLTKSTVSRGERLNTEWKWLDGSEYRPDQTKWISGEPGHLEKMDIWNGYLQAYRIKLGPKDWFHSSLELFIQSSYLYGDDRYGYICSKKSRQPSPSKPDGSPSPSAIESSTSNDSNNSIDVKTVYQPEQESDKSFSLSFGQSAAVGAGTAGLILILIAVIIYFLFKRTKRRKLRNTEEHNYETVLKEEQDISRNRIERSNDENIYSVPDQQLPYDPLNRAANPTEYESLQQHSSTCGTRTPGGKRESFRGYVEELNKKKMIELLK